LKSNIPIHPGRLSATKVQEKVRRRAIHLSLCVNPSNSVFLAVTAKVNPNTTANHRISLMEMLHMIGARKEMSAIIK